MGPQKIKNGVTVKPADRKKILTGNVNLIDKVRRSQFTSIRGFEKFPVSM